MDIATTDRKVKRREVTKALCWLPPRSADHERHGAAQGTWSRVGERWRISGRIGRLVIAVTGEVDAHQGEAHQGYE